MLKKFNEPKTSYNFIMSEEEAKQLVDEDYSGESKISTNLRVSDVKAAEGQIYPGYEVS
jgi:hypothetical protein